jgi:sulfur carrier protein|tara:strand:- start:1380 stop:1598 length:219 start_codon:yes stop_codon:yes gene_type:complete
MNISNKLKIQLNGKKYQIIKGLSLSKLLKKLKINNNKAAVELNGQITDKKRYNNIILKKNDKLEVVHFIGGG